MAHTKAGGSTKLGRDSQSKRLGVKKYSGELVKSGNILIRQRGSKWAAGENVAVGRMIQSLLLPQVTSALKKGPRCPIQVKKLKKLL